MKSYMRVRGKQGFKCLVVGGLALLLAAMILPGCAPSAPPQGTTPAEVEQVWVIPIITDITGPYATNVTGYYAAMDDWVAVVNDQGGFNGIKVRIDWLDTQGSLDRSITYFNRIISQKKKPPLMIGWVSMVHEAMKSRFEEEEIPLITGAMSAPQFAPPGWIFGECPDYASVGGGVVKWFVEDYWPKWKPDEAAKRAPRVGAITWDNAFGRGPMTDECIAYYTKTLGVDWVGAEFVPAAPIDVSTQVAGMVKRNPDFIIGDYHSGPFAAVLKESVKQGLKTLNNENVLWNNVVTGADYNLPLLCGPEEYFGVTSWTMAEGWDVDTPVAHEMAELFKRNNRPVSMRLGGYWNGLILYAISEGAMSIAMETKAFEEVTGRDIYNALCSGKQFDMRGMTPDFGYSSTKRTPNKTIIQAFTKEGKLLPITDWLTCPDLLPGGKDVPK